MRRIACMIVLFLLSSVANAQSTFRGGISGTVADPQGAIIAGAIVQAKNAATGLTYATVSSGAGSYSIQDLPLGDYSVFATFTGFAKVKIDGLRISAGVIFDLPVTIPLAETTTIDEVYAAALSLDTTSQVQTYNSATGKRLCRYTGQTSAEHIRPESDCFWSWISVDTHSEWFFPCSTSALRVAISKLGTDPSDQ
jgi:hypothetical protein